MYRFLTITLGLLLALTLTAAPALGQQSHRVDSISLPNTISANELGATAQLYTQIETIHAIYQTKLIAAETTAEKTALKVKRVAEIQKEIRSSTLSAKQYRAILSRAGENEGLQTRLKDRIRQVRTEATGKQDGMTTLNAGSSQEKQCSAGPSKANTK